MKTSKYKSKSLHNQIEPKWIVQTLASVWCRKTLDPC